MNAARQTDWPVLTAWIALLVLETLCQISLK